MTTPRQPTLGESRVGISFNPSGDSRINRIKRLAADLIDEIEAVQDHAGAVGGEIRRVKSIAQTEIEGGAHFAVKAAARAAKAAGE